MTGATDTGLQKRGTADGSVNITESRAASEPAIENLLCNPSNSKQNKF